MINLHMIGWLMYDKTLEHSKKHKEIFFLLNIFWSICIDLMVFQVLAIQ